MQKCARSTRLQTNFKVYWLEIAAFNPPCKKQTHSDLVNYLHAACFSPVKSSFIAAIKQGFLKTWPGLSAKLVEKYLSESIATAKGHMVQERQHLQSTKSKNVHPIDQICEKLEDLSLNITHNTTDIHNRIARKKEKKEIEGRDNSVAYMIINHDKDNSGYLDTTGRFPQRSSRGNQYIFIGYHYNANAILALPLKDRNAATLTKAWTTMHKMFQKSTNAPNVYILDNEISNDLISAFKVNNVQFQVAPPHNHRTNLAERAIQTWKKHFKVEVKV